jgi:hypothetical protein
MTKIAGSGSRIRIRIHQSEAWIRGSGSGTTPKCHGSGTLLTGGLIFKSDEIKCTEAQISSLERNVLKKYNINQNTNTLLLKKCRHHVFAVLRIWIWLNRGRIRTRDWI